MHPSRSQSLPAPIERFRSYLNLQARANLHPLVRGKLAASDIVQETLLEAYRDRGQFRGDTSAQQAVWLRRILGRNLANAARDLLRMKRDVGRERSLEPAVEESCLRVQSWLEAGGNSPSEAVILGEREIEVAARVEALPEAQQEAVVLRYWQGLPLAEIARRMERSPAAVAGLLHRGLRQLRDSLPSE
ncbi:MAG: RNA polymerase sigma-70 factor (ECF subfamily) [Planctomycetota bacterium]|jgi:RNA polymerase sigma-70 factor (ECF subfamily)